jgi:hypothetical protein
MAWKLSCPPDELVPVLALGTPGPPVKMLLWAQQLKLGWDRTQLMQAECEDSHQRHPSHGSNSKHLAHHTGFPATRAFLS